MAGFYYQNERGIEMAKYRKKPVVIEAFQMTQENRRSGEMWPSWLRSAWVRGAGENGIWIDQDADGERLVCGTLEGVHKITWSDWIIQGVKGEIYPCKPDIFEATYEAVE